MWRFISNLAKHSHLDDAQSAIEHLQFQLRWCMTPGYKKAVVSL